MNGFDLSTSSGIYIGGTLASAAYLGSTLVWSAGPPPIDYSTMPLTIESLEDNNEITIKSNGFTDSITMIINVPQWGDMAFFINASTTNNIFTLNRGEKIQIKNGWPTTCTNSNYLTIGSSGTFNVYGNIMSVFGENNGSYITTLPSTYQFIYMFNQSQVVDASNLILPATTLSDYCYSYMFFGCTSLTTAPELPATTLANYCYSSMFRNCTSLVSDPALPATTLSDYCYYYMFYGCTSLVSTPALPATTLANYCYGYMFSNTNVLPDCTYIDFTSSTVVLSGGLKSLFTGTKVTDNDLINILPKNSNNKYCLPVTTLTTTYCYTSMFSGCTSLKTAPELPATTLSDYCYNNMFQGCTSLTTPPELPATILAQHCYKNMFMNCSSLTATPALPATTLANECYYSMFQGCSALTTIPYNLLPATTLAQSCYRSMFDKCSHITNAPALPATTLESNCYRSMFYQCSSLTTAPELPATTLVSNCYYSMFYQCTSLNYIKAMFTTKPGSSYTSNWVYGVSKTGTFVKNSAATWNVTGNNGVPSGWTIQTTSS